MDDLPALDGTREGDLRWCGAFFAHNANFLLGVDVPDTVSVLSPPTRGIGEKQRPIAIDNGKRAPNPRICFSESATGYLYDRMTGAARFHILLFGSTLQGPVRARIAHFSQRALGPQGFFARFGASSMFNVVLVLKCLPWEKEALLQGDDLRNLREHATVVFDDRSPEEDAAYWYGINHARGAVVAVRPDLWVGMSCWPEEGDDVLGEYFGGFLVERKFERGFMSYAAEEKLVNGLNGMNGVDGAKEVNDINGMNDTDHLKTPSVRRLPGYEANCEIKVVNGVGRVGCPSA